MGVIKKNDSKVSIFSPTSDDSLQTAQSDDELSIASVSTDVSTNIPQPVPQQRNYPKPMSFHNTRRRMGKKQSRRHDNAMLLETLVEESEIQEITLQDLMQNPSPGFSRLFEDDNMEKWYEFMESSEEVQKKIIEHSPKKRSSPFNSSQNSAGKEFQRIKSGVRNVLKRSHVPVGMLTYLETEVVNFFSKSPQSVYISGILSSFERLLLHAISQYHQLCSFSRTDESSHTRHVHVWNDNDGYTIPKMLLSEYLESREQKSAVN
ncbi:R3H domain-containing protein 4-like isoform X2 [Schistocerca nitens]|uniref:R3H domain-containing protein 4-like isoform X2 n=1 Tax=Schistocerca nitens TaxID=7011 RepID=UPI002118AE6D|nr:R3H domain-containing protein 4-like isoform X2 [Schistocerca nitens]